jgi:DNA-binding CsgD family transcriptional regulator
MSHVSSDVDAGTPDAIGEGHADLVHAYRILLQHPQADLADFATHLRVDLPTAREILDRLAAVSLVEQRETAFVTVSPLLAMQHLIDREHAHLEQRQRLLLESCDALSEVLPSYRELRTTPAATACAEQLTDLPTIRHRLEELAVGATTEVLSLTPPARDPSGTRSASRSLDLSVLRRGVRMRTIYPELLYDDVETQRYAAELTGAGGSVRFASELPLRLVIVDRARAAVPNDPDDATGGCLLISHPGVVSALVALFESYWRVSREFGADDCSPLERVVLQRLMVGAKDESIARHLGLSVRTVRRCVAELMARIEATSRFELGVIAAQRSWI